MSDIVATRACHWPEPPHHATMSKEKKPGVNAPLPTRHYGDILWVEYIGGRPHAAKTSNGDYYDFEFSKRLGCGLFHCSGFGGDDAFSLSKWVDPGAAKPSFWAADEVRLCEEDRFERVDASAADWKALGYARLPKLPGDPFEDAIECGHIVYCSVCDDYMDDDENCRHVWSNDYGEVVGPGSNEPAEACKASFLSYCRRYGRVRSVRSQLPDLKRRLGTLADRNVVDDLQDGMRWLQSLDEKTTEANAITATWLDEEIAVQGARRASGEPVYVLRLFEIYVTERDLPIVSYWSADKTVCNERSGVRWTASQKHARRMSWPDAVALRKRVALAGTGANITCLVPSKKKQKRT